MKPVYAGIVGVLLAVVGPACAHFELVAPVVGFTTFLLGAVPGLVAVVWGLGRIIRHRDRWGGLAAAIGMLPVLAVGVPFALAASAGHPAINDIATDLRSPPELASGVAFPPGFKATVRRHYDHLRPITTGHSGKQAHATALALAKRQPQWKITEVRGLDIYGVATSGIFRFHDDFAIRVRPTPDGSKVDMRSRSRVGKSDLGVNARRIGEFLTELTRHLRASE